MNQVVLAAGIIIVIFLSATLTSYGLIRYIYQVEDDNYVNRDSLILAGNIFQSIALMGSIGFLMANDPSPGASLLVFPIFISLILILYLTNMDKPSQAGEWSALILLMVDACLKLTAVLVGYGVCSVDQVPQALSNMASTIIGGRRR
jgi:hypothetical protein